MVHSICNRLHFTCQNCGGIVCKVVFSTIAHAGVCATAHNSIKKPSVIDHSLLNGAPVVYLSACGGAICCAQLFDHLQPICGFLYRIKYDKKKGSKDYLNS